MKTTDIVIDWGWVEEIILKKERISPASHSSITENLIESIDAAKRLALPKIATATKPVLSCGESSVKLRNDREFRSSALASHMKGSTHLYLFIVTIGPAIEDKASALMMEADGLSGYFLDRIGSFAVESLAENLEQSLRKECESEGGSLSSRFSPGYCDWPIEDQVKLNTILDFSRAGVHLNENCMMKPMKSISGVIGAGPKGLFSRKSSHCEICNMKNCGYRRV